MYGLGANVFNPAAVLSIFRYKGRPLTDPLIVHVPSSSAASKIVSFRGDADAQYADATTHAEPLQSVAPRGRLIFDVLAHALWPGPLTLVARAARDVPPIVTANSGFVGVRVPAHPIALALLRAAGVPIAAPSANRFGHVSPTSAAHVFADLGSCPIGIMLGEGDMTPSNQAVVNEQCDDAREATRTDEASTCAIGIESTVVRVDDEWDGGWDNEVAANAETASASGPQRLRHQPQCVDEDAPSVSDNHGSIGDAGTLCLARAAHMKDNVYFNNASNSLAVRLLIYRRGGVAPSALRGALDAAGFCDVPIHFAPPPKSAMVSATTIAAAAVAASGEGSTLQVGGGEGSTLQVGGGEGSTLQVGDAAPGQLLSHYAPDIPALLVVRSSATTVDSCTGIDKDEDVGRQLATTVVIDIGGQLAAHLRTRRHPLPDAVTDDLGVLAYRDLSSSADAAEACRGVFNALRWSEQVVGANRVLLADPRLLQPTQQLPEGPPAVNDATREAWDALRDRLFRASSGCTVDIRDVL